MKSTSDKRMTKDSVFSTSTRENNQVLYLAGPMTKNQTTRVQIYRWRKMDQNEFSATE